MRVVYIIYVHYLCNMKFWLTAILLFVASYAYGQEDIDKLYHIDEVEITASAKSGTHYSSPISSTTLNLVKLEERGISSAKDISTIAPNFYQPDYGSSITSSIYVRGFGSRIDQPVMGMTIDEVPVMNKNSYDFDFYDIRSVELLRGTQSTLYGRNTSGGVMNIRTLSPMVWQGWRAMVEASSELSYRASLAHYAKPKEQFGISVAAAYSHNNGFFENRHRGEMCDRGDNGSMRLRMQWQLKNRWSLDNSLSASYTDEGGYAYHPYNPTTHRYSPIAYNDPSGYERLTINEGLVAKYSGDKIRITSITSYSFLGDKMTLDQDFSTKSMFTMQQRQREHAITEDIVIRNANEQSRWQWLSGAFVFAKWLDMSSPVTFKEDGINELILGNINNGISTVFPNNKMSFNCDNFVINSNFKIPTYGAALYHHSTVNLGAWTLTAGVRIDLEYTSMRYNSNTTIPYRFDLTMTDYKDLYSEFSGRESQLFFEVLPKIAAQYDFGHGNAYATITRGYKSGGFNTQIFSDILQVKMMNDMMAELGIELDSVGQTTTYDSAEATKYKPETTWNFEVGTHLNPTPGLNIDASLFWIECFDQQVTVLPKGMSTGRMMSNASRARSAGVELSASYEYRGLNIMADYGFTDARFREYNDGTADYQGNVLPYAPRNTISVMAGYTWRFAGKTLRSLTVAADWRGIGRIYWDEANTLSQPIYSLLGAQVMLNFKKATLAIWGRNLTNKSYDVFYFKSVGKEFFSKGAPLHCGIRLNINI